MGVCVALRAIDFAAGLPPMWGSSEGPPTVLVADVWLARRAM
jgi:hypothetical protein